jgi:TctA family transporter
LDADFVSAALEGLRLVFSWPYVLYPVAATLVAMAFSATPGINTATLMSLAIPLTIGWDPLQVVLVFGALVGGATYMGSVSAILFNIPGKASSAVAMLDGYPLTQQGRAMAALGCAAAASALGSTFGVGILLLLLPAMREAAMTLGPPEYLMIAIWGMTMIATLAGGDPIKGLIAALLGLQLAFIGADPRTAEPRFTFGFDYLQDGLSLVPVLLGLFAIAELIDLMASARITLSGHLDLSGQRGGAREGILAVLRHFGLTIRSSIIGVVIGAIPGVGGSVAGFVAYGHANQTARDRSQFGKGDIRGVLAPEAAMDAKDGGALVPTLALGIPGGTATALLLGALTMHGLTPGRPMLTDHLVLVFVLIWSLFLSNWLTSLLGLSLVRPLARLSTIRTSRLVPVILALAMVGSVQYRGLPADAFCALAFGVVGYLMKRHGWPRVPLVIAMTLAPLFEANLHLTTRLHELGRIDFWSRPLVIALAVLNAASLALPVLRRLRGSVPQAQP